MPPQPQHIAWRDVPSEALTPLLDRQFVTGKQAMLARFHLRKGCVVPEHSHVSEQLSYILTGSLKFQFRNQDGSAAADVIVRGGEVLVIPSNLPHSAVALEDCDALDIFSPVREDWLSGQDGYLRGQR